jgi:DNA-binding response OmpR family regulator
MEGQNDNTAVLVLDDDLDILAELHDLLEHQEYQVTCASTCHDALAQALGFRYSTVLLDIGLPDGEDLPCWIFSKGNILRFP